MMATYGLLDTTADLSGENLSSAEPPFSWIEGETYDRRSPSYVGARYAMPSDGNRSQRAHTVRLYHRLIEMINRGDLAEVVAVNALHTVGNLLFDGAPTPRASYPGDGFVEVHWLVGDNSIELAFAPDGSVDVLATQANGDRVVEAEFASSVSFLASQARTQILRELKAMSGLLVRAR
jgi:hypothetical protein